MNLEKWEKFNLKLYKIFLHIIGFTKDKTSRNLFRLFQIAFYAVAIIFIINLISLFDKETNFGTWGDFFGGVLNPILTFLTFMGLLITIILQQKELKQSRKEFQGQKEALENQEFDNKFFQMLHLFNNIKENLQLDSKKGQNVIQELKKLLIIECASDYDYQNRRWTVDNVEKFKSKFKQFNKKYDINFKYYFLNLYQILNYIDKNKNNLSEAKGYSNIVRAQLSKDELILLFYNAIGIIDISGTNYKKLIEKYSMFEHLNKDDITHYIEYNHKKINPNYTLVTKLTIEYDKTAFGKNKDMEKFWMDNKKANKT